jgi:general stress protein 26
MEMNDTLKAEIRALRENSKVAYIASINEGGYPQIKGMLVPECDSMQTQYFSTNFSSKRAQ